MQRQRGYILIYAMAILLFLVGTVTGAAYALRLDAQESYQQRERLKAEFRLRGALQYALAQFARAPPTATAAPSGADRFDETQQGWRLEPSSYQLQIDGTAVSVAIDDPGGIANANALDERMWTDYFAALGVARPGEATRWAAAVIAWKARVGTANGRGGFAAIDDLLALSALPASVRYGGWADAAPADSQQDTAPGLPDLFIAGGADRVLDVNRAALPLIAAVTGAGAEQLDAFRAARARGALTVGDAARLLGERARSLLQETRTDPVFRIVMTTAAGGASHLGLAAFVQKRDGRLRLLASRLTPAVSVDQRS